MSSAPSARLAFVEMDGEQSSRGQASTGIEGLDDVLGGGLPRGHEYLVEGQPGTGKTTLALQFALAGARAGESVLYITLAETSEELGSIAESHGWTLDGLSLCAAGPTEERGEDEGDYSLFHPSEVELGQTMKIIIAEIERLSPARIAIDALSELRLLAQDPIRYRRQVMALKRFLANRRMTSLLIDEAPPMGAHVRSLVHGIIQLEQTVVDYGRERRRLRVAKLRGRRYRDGYHDFAIAGGGLTVYPRLVAAEHASTFPPERISSGIEGLDRQLDGGIARGDSVLLLGPAGSGKTSIAVTCATANAARGRGAAIYIFDEARGAYIDRWAGLGIDLRTYVDSGKISVESVDPAEMSPGEFAGRIRRAVEVDGAQLVVIDSVSGYLHAMPQERFINLHLHELLGYLSHRDVTTFLIMVQHGFVADSGAPLDLSYLADTVILMRFFEALGEVRQAISIVKKRSGSHERTIREMRFTAEGISVGEPLRSFQGVLHGNPTYVEEK